MDPSLTKPPRQPFSEILDHRSYSRFSSFFLRSVSVILRSEFLLLRRL